RVVLLPVAQVGRTPQLKLGRAGRGGVLDLVMEGNALAVKQAQKAEVDGWRLGLGRLRRPIRRLFRRLGRRVIRRGLLVLRLRLGHRVVGLYQLLVVLGIVWRRYGRSLGRHRVGRGT